MNAGDIKRLIGELGERFVLGKFPYAVKSPDKYDMKKDGTLGPHIYEVKTAAYVTKTASLWMPENQWTKLDNVDYIFFITIPHKSFEYFREDKICQLFMSIHNKYDIIVRPNERVRSYKIEHMTPICDLDEELSQKIISLSDQLTKSYDRV